MVSALICFSGFKMRLLECMKSSDTACNFVLLNLLIAISTFQMVVFCACLRRVLGSKLCTHSSDLSAKVHQNKDRMQFHLEVILGSKEYLFCKMQTFERFIFFDRLNAPITTLVFFIIPYQHKRLKSFPFRRWFQVKLHFLTSSFCIFIPFFIACLCSYFGSRFIST